MLTASLLQPLVGLYTDRRPTPYSLVAGMGFSLVGLLLLSVAGTLRIAAAGGRTGRRRLVGLSSGVVARRAHGVRRTARPGAVGVPGRRQRRIVDRARCSRRSSSLPRGQPSIAWCSLLALLAMVVALAGRRLVSAHRRTRRTRRGRSGCATAAAPASVAAARRLVDRDPRGADLLEVLLPGEPEQLLHVLSDQQVPRLGADGADRSVHLPRRGGRRHDPRRADRRSLRPQAGDLGVDPRRPAVHAAAAATPICSGRGS